VVKEAHSAVSAQGSPARAGALTLQRVVGEAIPGVPVVLVSLRAQKRWPASDCVDAALPALAGLTE
jgi:hypothetical protein